MSAKQIKAKIDKLNERIKARQGEVKKYQEEKKKLTDELTKALEAEKAKPKPAAGGKKKKTAKKPTSIPVTPPTTT